MPRLTWPALPGSGSRAGESIRAWHWHCADLLAGAAAHLGQSCDTVRYRCVSRCFPFSLFMIHLQICCNTRTGLYQLTAQPLWQPGKIPLAKGEVCCHCNSCRWHSQPLYTCTRDHVKGREGAGTRKGTWPELTSTTNPVHWHKTARQVPISPCSPCSRGPWTSRGSSQPRKTRGWILCSTLSAFSFCSPSKQAQQEVMRK